MLNEDQLKRFDKLYHEVLKPTMQGEKLNGVGATINEYDKIQKTGLSFMDVETIAHIENNILNGNKELSRLIIKAYNNGFNKGVKESVRFIDCTQKGVEY